MPTEVAPLPSEDGDIIAVETAFGDQIHVWAHEFSRIKEPPWCYRTARFNLIYSHGRLEDITYKVLRHFLKCLARRLEINVYLYEWPGFGHSTGTPSESRVNAAIEAAYEHVISLNDKRVVLMGHSLGCGPTLNLAVKRGERSRSEYATPNKVAGGILKSAFVSSCAVAYPKCSALKNGCCQCCDLFRNIDRVQEMEVPVMVVHSKNDEMIDISHGERLHGGLPPSCQWDAWWLETERHAHLPINAREFFKRLDDFLEHLEDNDPALDEQQLEESHLLRQSLQQMPLVPILQDIQLQLFACQHALLLCCNRGKCCAEIKTSLKQKVAAMDEKCREAHRLKRSAEPYGGPFPVETVKEELELALQRMQLITETLEEPPSRHEPVARSSAVERLEDEDTPVSNEENPLTPRGSMLHRLATSALVNLDGFDDGRYVLRLRPLKGWFVDGVFEAIGFQAGANELLHSVSQREKALYVESSELTETEGEVWCPVVSSVDLERFFSDMMHGEARCIIQGVEVLSVAFQGPLEVKTVVMRESEMTTAAEAKGAFVDRFEDPDAKQDDGEPEQAERDVLEVKHVEVELEGEASRPKTPPESPPSKRMSVDTAEQ